MIDKRKIDHLRICIEKEVEAGNTGFAEIYLQHKALPEIDFDKIDMSTKFLGKKLNFPIIIEGMSGGVSDAKKLNKELAGIAQEYGIGFGVGSQRIAIENPEMADGFYVRDVAPDIFLIANLGAVQLNYGYSLKECKRAIEMIEADVLALHMNPLQEVIQPEGNKNFSGLIEKINSISKKLQEPLMMKCVGSGISYDIAKKLRVSAIDVGGSGGTSWSLIESYRGNDETRNIGKAFAGWGIPTAESIKEISKMNIPIIASGGIRDGINAAKAIALGSDCVGMALPILRAWSYHGIDGVKKFLDQFIMELRICMFLTGSKTVNELKGKTR
ncbi:MAG TPA: type 2 isopentenyl-diphosphate Delta-isomerase [Candidatus Altiarchaeales archaeon]|nr:type 2 isopentenyl-diphosphate Delta-isomerase [Candidatus Altiarchaeales archaeon]